MKFLHTKLGASLSLLALLASCSITDNGGSGSSTESSANRGDAGAPHSISVEMDSRVSQTQTQSVLVATVKDANGRPVPHARVEWLLAQGSVGSLLEIDTHGSSDNHRRLNSGYAMTATNADDRNIGGGMSVGRGSTWCALTSPIEGSTYVIAYCPDIEDWERQKAFTTKEWRDVAITLPTGSTNRVGASVPMAVQVSRQSDGAALAGQEVTFTITGGPPATLGRGGQTVTMKTDAQGMASTTLNQTRPATGTNTVNIRVVRPANEKCCLPAVLLADENVEYKWVAPSINIEKTAPPKSTVGANFDYNIVVSSTGDTTARNVVVTDTLPAGISYVSSVPTARVSGQSLSWDMGNLDRGGKKSIKVTVKGTRTGKFTNCAQVSAEDGALTDEDCADTVISAPKLALTKTGPAEVLRCDEIEYSFTVSNGGDAPATNVRITDTLPEGLTTADNRNSFTLDVGTLPAGQSKTMTAKVKANRRGNFTNTAVATADGGLRSEATARTVVREPVLRVTKTGPERRFTGRPVTFEITVTNTGDGPARETVLRDPLPTGSTLVNATDNGTQTGGAVVWNLGTLNPNQSRTVSMTLTTERSGVMRNVATASAFCAADASDSAETLFEGIPAILLEVVDLDDPIEVGANIVYEITVTNQGSAPGKNIAIRATLPRETQFASGDGPTSASSQGNTVSFAPLASLAPKAKATYRLTVKAVGAADIRFKVSMTSDQSPVPVEETESTYIYQ